ncbi:hypothetical protein P7K49_035360, partial [Saguinus oedipus]
KLDAKLTTLSNYSLTAKIGQQKKPSPWTARKQAHQRTLHPFLPIMEKESSAVRGTDV